MAIDERSRHELYARLEVVLGPDPATTLMSHLPPVGWADVATKTDLDALRASTKADLEIVATGLRADLVAGLAGLRADLVGQMAHQTRTMIIALVTVVLAMASLGLVRG